MNLLFWRKKAPLTELVVTRVEQTLVGKIFDLNIPNEDGPFGPKKERVGCAQVLEEKDGWVRYRLLPIGSLYQDERRPIETFLKMYSETKK